MNPSPIATMPTATMPTATMPTATMPIATMPTATMPIATGTQDYDDGGVCGGDNSCFPGPSCEE